MKKFLSILAVLIALAIVAVVLFPVFAVSPSNHRPNRPLSDVKQLSIATIFYLSDYDDRYPHATQMSGIRASLFPYVKIAELFKETPDSSLKEFNFNLSSSKSNAIPLGYSVPPPTENTTVWYSLSILKDHPGAFHSRIDGSVKFVPLPKLFETFQYQYPRDASTLAPADYLADQDPLKEQTK